VVAQAEAFDREGLVVDAQLARDRHVLLVVGLRELLLRRSRALPAARLPTVHGAHGVVHEVERQATARALGERRTRVPHRTRLGELEHLPLVDAAKRLARLQHLEAEPAGGEGLVVVDPGPVEAEQHPAVG
jgi:hypothetical protein